MPSVSWSRLAPVLLLVGWGYLLGVLGMYSWANPSLYGHDPFFHARLSNQLPERLFDRKFPETSYSIWNDYWGDKEMLFHVWMMPFCQGESTMLQGAKIAGALLVVLQLWGLGWAMKRQGIVGAWWWPILMLFASATWWFRMTVVRAYIGSLALFPFFIWATERRRAKPLFVILFIYSWTYTIPFLGLALVTCLLIARWMVRWGRPDIEKSCEGDSDLSLLLHGAAGTALGMLIHPNMPNHLVTLWIVVRDILASAWGLPGAPAVQVADEFKSEVIRYALLVHPGVFAMMAFSWTIAAAGPIRLSERSATHLVFTVPLMGLYALSGRFMEYAAPGMLWAFASVVSDQIVGYRAMRATGQPFAWPDFPTWMRRAVLIFGPCVLYGIHFWFTAIVVMGAMDASAMKRQRDAALWVRDHSKPGDLVIHPDWAQFPELYFYAPELRYICGMDPMLMNASHPRELQILEELRDGFRVVDMQELQKLFPGARYMIVWDASWPLHEQMRRQGYRAVYSGEPGSGNYASVYDLQQEPMPVNPKAEELGKRPYFKGRLPIN